MTPLQILCSFQSWNAAPVNIKQHKALLKVVNSIINRGTDPNSVGAKNTVAESVAGAAKSEASKNNLSKNISRLHPSGVPGGALEEVFNWFNDNKFLINTKFGQTIFHMALKVIIILININALKVWSRRANNKIVVHGETSRRNNEPAVFVLLSNTSAYVKTAMRSAINRIDNAKNSPNQVQPARKLLYV